MLALDDPRWTKLRGGYRANYDPRAVLRRLEKGEALRECWDELWEELHHQGDVDLASFASVPHLVRIAPTLPKDDWNIFALVGTIALLAGKSRNPEIPDWLAAAHSAALLRLAEIARDRLAHPADPLVARSCMGVIALVAGLPHHAELLLHFDDSEVADIVANYGAS